MLSGDLRRLRPSVLAAALALLVSGGVLGLRAAGVLESSELAVYDRLLRFARPAGEIDPRVVLVRVTERDIQEIGHPVPDEALARALRTLGAAGARAIGVDLYRDRPVPPGAAELESAVRENPAIVMTEKTGGEDDDPVPAPEYVAGTPQVGFSDVTADRDGSLRRGLLMMHQRGIGGVSLAFRLAVHYLAVDGLVPRWTRSASGSDSPLLKLGDAPLPRLRANDGGYAGADAGGYQILLSHPRGRTRFASIALGDALSGALPSEAVRDRVVLIGSAAASVRDRHRTPFGETSGLEHHAQVVSELLDRARGGAGGVRFLGDLWESALILACGVVGALVAAWVRSAWALAASVAGLVGILLLGSLELFRAGWWLPAMPAGLAFAGSGAIGLAWVSFAERQERRLVMDLFGRFLQPEVAESIWRERGQFLDGGRPRARSATITVMMSDLVGYTAVSERLDPPRLMEWVNDYLEAMARVVGSHGGVVDDFAGDGIKADFGVPVPRRTDAEVCADAVAAVESALAMEVEVERLNRRCAERGLPPARVRVGLHTGPAVVGVIGGPPRLKFTTLGDTVNTAQRLESYRSEEFRAEHAGMRLLVSGETFRRLGGGYRAEELGKVEFKGKAEPVAVYRIRGRVADAQQGGREA